MYPRTKQLEINPPPSPHPSAHLFPFPVVRLSSSTSPSPHTQGSRSGTATRGAQQRDTNHPRANPPNNTARMSSGLAQESADIAKAHVPDAAIQGTEKELTAGRGSIDPGKFPPHDELSVEEEYEDTPTEEELRTLRRVSGKLKWAVWTIAFAELCERFSYYGSSILYTNFVQRPLPEGSTTGASEGTSSRIPGALGQGQKAAQGIVLFNQFFAYVMPLLG